MMDTVETDVLIIGAGVMGLSVAATLSPSHTAVVIDRHDRFGCETSSRNSEVVHSGIYYPADSLKTRLCIAGRELLYRIAEQARVPIRKCGKLVVAVTDAEGERLEKLAKHAAGVGVTCLPLNQVEVKRREPLVSAASGLFFPDSGIVDSHQWMGYLERQARERGIDFAYRHRVISFVRSNNRWSVECSGPGGMVRIRAAKVVNAAGLAAAEVMEMMLGEKKYSHRFCRGRYFSLPTSFQGRFHHLVYPLPEKDGLGVHVTLDMDGNAKLGPDTDWMDCPTYSGVDSFYDCDWDALRVPFAAAASKFLTGIEAKSLTPGQIGIRPKLFVDGKAHPEFVVEYREGSIHFLGIESPGLTASLALAKWGVEKAWGNQNA